MKENALELIKKISEKLNYWDRDALVDELRRLIENERTEDIPCSSREHLNHVESLSKLQDEIIEELMDYNPIDGERYDIEKTIEFPEELKLKCIAFFDLAMQSSGFVH